MPDSNVYPVAPCRRVWYLDRQRQSPKLRVSRTQFPLAPQFAITAHVAQGQTTSKKAWWPTFASAQWATHSRFTSQSPASKAVGSCWSSAPSTPHHSKKESVWAGTFFCDTSAATPSTGRHCSQNIAKNACVQLAQNENKAQRLHLANGSAATLTGRVASAQNIMQMLEPRGNATCASCGMSRPIFQKSIANGNVVFSVFVWHAKSRSHVSNAGFPRQRKTMALLPGKLAMLLPRLRPEAAGVLVLRRMFRAKTTRRVYGLARKPRLQSRWHAVLQHVHQFSLGVSNCPSRERTVDTATAAREKSTATGHHRRSAPRNSGKDQAENHDCFHPRHAKLQRPIARLHHRFRAPWGCHRKRSQPRGTTPTRAGCDSKERQTDPPVPMSILPATCEKHCGDWAN